MAKIGTVLNQYDLTLNEVLTAIYEYCVRAHGLKESDRRLEQLSKHMKAAAKRAKDFSVVGVNSKYHIRIAGDAVWTYLPEVFMPDARGIDWMPYVLEMASELTVFPQLPGRSLSEKEVVDILDYVDSEFCFGDIVLAGTEMNILIFNETIGMLCSEYFPGNDQKRATLVLHATPDVAGFDPTASMFIMLGHAIHHALTSDVNEIPKKYLQLLQKCRIANIFELDCRRQADIFHAALGIGLMAHSHYLDELSYMRAVPEDEINDLRNMTNEILATIDMKNKEKGVLKE